MPLREIFAAIDAASNTMSAADRRILSRIRRVLAAYDYDVAAYVAECPRQPAACAP